MVDNEPVARIFRRYTVATLAVVCMLILVLVIYKVRFILVMLALGGFLAYFLNWPITWLTRWMSRANAIRVVFYSFLLLMLALVGPIGGLLYTQGVGLMNNIPNMLAKAELYLSTPELSLPFGLSINLQEQLAQAVETLRTNSGEVLNRIFDYTQTFLSGTLAVVGAMLFIPLMTLYFLMDGPRLRESLVSCFNENWRDEVDEALRAVSQSLGGYVYGKTVASLMAGILTTIALYIIGIPFALVLGLLVLIGEYIPIVGNWIAFIPIAIVALANDPIDLLWVTIITLIIQGVQNYIVVPKLMGESMNLHPLTVLLALLAGGTVAGLPGMILALPAAAAGKIILNIFVFHRSEQGIPATPVISWRLPKNEEDPVAGGIPEQGEPQAAAAPLSQSAAVAEVPQPSGAAAADKPAATDAATSPTQQSGKKRRRR